MKTCPQCKVRKEDTEFYSDSKAGRLRNTCKTCEAVTRKERYWLNPEKYRKQALDHYKSDKDYRNRQLAARHKRNVDRINKLKEKPCTDCGGKYPTYVTEFDHINGDGRGRSIGHLLWLPWTTIERELKKCELVCANCHKIRTHKLKFDNGKGGVGCRKEE